MAQIIYVQLTGSVTSPGPYNVYNYNTGQELASNLSLTSLQQGFQTNVSDATTQISVVNVNPACATRTVIKNIVGIPPSPSPTPSLTPNASPSPTPTQSPLPPSRTPDPTRTPTITPTITTTPTPTPSITPSPTIPLVNITVNLTIDSGNAGSVTLFNGNTITQIGSPLTSNSSYTFSIPNGTQFYVVALHTVKAFSYQLSTIYNYINSIPDACSPYYQTALAPTENKTSCGGVFTTATLGNSYFVDVYLGNQR